MTSAMETKVRKVGSSNGVILPKEALSFLQAGEGDRLQLVPTEEGLLIKVYDEQFEKTKQYAERFRERYRKTLAELAK